MNNIGKPENIKLEYDGSGEVNETKRLWRPTLLSTLCRKTREANTACSSTVREPRGGVYQASRDFQPYLTCNRIYNSYHHEKGVVSSLLKCWAKPE